MQSFLDALAEQRWDDHRYYHHSRINQTLHFLSAISFLCAYALLFVNPAFSGLVGWLVGMMSRQSGHFFFEPKSYDEVNHVTHEYKEEVKVGYNLFRKVVLMLIWAALPLALYLKPDLFGMVAPHTDFLGFMQNVGLMWLYLGIVGLLFRTVHLFFIKDIGTGLVWLSKIITDPYHDIKLYHRAPLALLRGELIDPMYDVLQRQAEEGAAEPVPQAS